MSRITIFATASDDTARRFWTGELASESDQWPCYFDGYATKPQARRMAHTAIALGPWKAARVFEGRNGGRLILNVVDPKVTR